MRAVYAVLLAWLCACTEVTRTSVASEPPETIAGAYAATWGPPASLLGTCAIGDEGAVGLAPYPCATTAQIGGSGEYDPGTGAWAAELKTIGGDVKVVLEGVFSEPAGGGLRSMVGSYAVFVLAAPCVAGPLSLEEVPP